MQCLEQLTFLKFGLTFIMYEVKRLPHFITCKIHRPIITVAQFYSSKALFSITLCVALEDFKAIKITAQERKVLYTLVNGKSISILTWLFKNIR